MNKSFEYLNTITAGIGMILSMIGFIFLIIISNKYGTYWHVIWCSVYGITLMILHTSSTLYHGTVSSNIKKKFRILDHVSIYLLISGTYTPIVLISLYSTLGISILSIIWLLSILGIVLNIKKVIPFSNYEVLLYLFMGWFCLLGIKQIVNVIDMDGIKLLFSGGLLYTVGVFFYKWKNFKYSHAIWHLFVISGSTCHYFTILFYVIPFSS